MRRFLCFILCCTMGFVAQAATLDSLYSYREDGTFHTFCQVEVDCNNAIANEVVDDFISQFRGDPNLLFEWALKDIGRQDDSEKDELLLVLKNTTFDRETGIGTILTDIKIPGLRTFEDIKIESRVTKTQLPNGDTEISVDVFYSNVLIKKAYGVYRIVPLSNGKQLFNTTVSIKFGWFFDIFITKKRYRSIVEWRAKGFMDNMRAEAERRQLFFQH